MPVLAAGAVFSCPLDVVSSRPVLAGGRFWPLLASCPSCPLIASRPVSHAVPLPVSLLFVISPRLATRRAGRFGLRLGLGSPRSLLPVACRGGAWDAAERFLSWMLLVVVVSMVSVGGVISVVPVACRVPFSRARPLVLACLVVALVACGSWRSRYRLRPCLASSLLFACPCRRASSWVG